MMVLLSRRRINTKQLNHNSLKNNTLYKQPILNTATLGIYHQAEERVLEFESDYVLSFFYHKVINQQCCQVILLVALGWTLQCPRMIHNDMMNRK